MAEDERGRLEIALRGLGDHHSEPGAAERAIADYCRGRHGEGALAETVIVEVKRLVLQILGRDSAHLERLVTQCIKHFYKSYSAVA